jgi:hypothetical protein
MTLLGELACRFPCEVLANPVLEMELVETGRSYGQFPLKGLISLCLASSHEVRQDLLIETRSRIAREISKLEAVSEAELSCIWRGRRTFIISASDFSAFVSMSELDADIKDDLISRAKGKYPAVYEMEYRAFVDGAGPIEFEGLPLLDSTIHHVDPSEKERLSRFLKAVSTGSIDEFVNDYEIIRDASGDGELKVTPLTMTGDLEALIDSTFEFCHCVGDNSDPIECQEDYLLIPVGAPEECELQYDFELGEFVELLDFKDDFTKMQLRDSWHVLLAELLCS